MIHVERSVLETWKLRCKDVRVFCVVDMTQPQHTRILNVKESIQMSGAYNLMY